MSNSRNPASILYDAYGNEVAILEGYEILATSPGLPIMARDENDEATFLNTANDGGLERLMVDAYLSSTLPGVGTVNITDEYGSDIVSIIDDTTTPADKRLMVQADIKEGATIAVTSGQTTTNESISDSLLNGGSEDMVVNGSTTPVSFTYGADPADTIRITSLRLVFSAAFFDFDGASFGKGGGALANGVTINLVANDGDVNKTLSTLVVNEDFLRLLEFSISQGGSTDVMAASVIFGGNVQLVAGSSDQVEVLISDNLTSGAHGIHYFTATLYGFVEV